MKNSTIVISLGILLASVTFASAQESRTTLQNFNNSHINANGKGAITGPVVNSMNDQMITSMGVLNDTNTWTGTNIFNGSVVIPGGTAGFQCQGNEAKDDAPALNAAVQAIRDLSPAAGNSWPIGNTGTLALAAGTKCIIKTSLNWTSAPNVNGQPNSLLLGSGFTVSAWGAQIVCETVDTICIDATGEGHGNFLGINLYGSCTTGQVPRVGIVFARPTPSLALGAGYNYLDHPNMSGCFTLAGYYARSSEETQVNHGEFNNFQPGTSLQPVYAAVFDGLNHWNVQSVYLSSFYPVGQFSSNNNHQCIDCNFEVFDPNAIPIWLGGVTNHLLVRGYAFAPNSIGLPAAVFFFGNNNNAPIDNLHFDVHSEDKSLGCVIQFDGSTNVTASGLFYHDKGPEQSGPIFCRSSVVSTVALPGFNANVGTLGGTSPSWWDVPSAFTATGYVYNFDGSFILPNIFTGNVCAPNCISYANFNGAINVSGVNTAGIANSGSVISVTAQTPSGGGTSANWSTARLKGSMPTVVLSPVSGGGGADAHLSTIIALGTPNLTGGSGCHVSDTYSLTDNQSGGGLSSGGTIQLPITAINPVDGSVSTSGWASTFGSAFIFKKPLSSNLTLAPVSTHCITPPTIALNGNTGYSTGSWAPSNANGALASFVVDHKGAGYGGAPTVSFSTPFTGQGTGYVVPVAAIDAGSITITSGVINVVGGVTMPSLPTSAGTGGLSLCMDSIGVIYKKASCP